MGLGPCDKLIDDNTPMDSILIGGDDHGCIERDLSKYPQGYRFPAYSAIDMPIIPRSEWSDRIKEMTETKSRLSDLLAVANNGGPIVPLWQDGFGYCWMYSGGHACTAARAVNRLPYVKFSPFACAQIIKKGRNEGGWGALGVEFIQEHGIPTQDVWPNLKTGLQQDTPALRAHMAKYKITEGWIDLIPAVYDRTMSFDQYMTCLLCRIPVVSDFMWWRHSVCAIDPVEIERGSFGPRILNSQLNGPFEEQLMVLQGNRGKPDGAVGVRVLTAA